MPSSQPTSRAIKSVTTNKLLRSTARYSTRGGGIQTNALVFGGNVPAKTVNTELYDGTSWTEMNNLAAAVTSHGGDGLGTSKSWLAVGGATNPGNTNLTTTQEFLISINSVTGAAWASGGAMNTGRSEGMTAGTQTASLMSGGIVPGSDAMTNNSEEYNGTSWSEQNNLSSSRKANMGAGTAPPSLALTFGGNDGTNRIAASEEWQGAGAAVLAWATGNVMNLGRRTLAGDFPLVNKHLVDDLLSINSWNIDVKQIIMADDGSIKNVPNIPLIFKKLYKKRFKNCEEMLFFVDLFKVFVNIFFTFIN